MRDPGQIGNVRRSVFAILALAVPAAVTALSFWLRDSAGRGGIVWALYPVIGVVMGLVFGFVAAVISLKRREPLREIALIGFAVEVLLGAVLLWQRLL